MYRAGAEARARLHMALISTARNARSSTQPGAREQVLASLRQAAAIDPSSEVRNELISALAMTSLHVSQITPWRGTLAPGWSQDLTTEARLEENAVKLYRNGNPLPAPAMEPGRIPVEIGNFSPDGKWLAMKMPDESNAVWSLERNTWLEYLPALRMVCFSPDSQTLVGDSGGGTLYVRPMDKLEGIYVHWDRNSLRPLGYSPDGRYFAVSHYAHPRMAVLSTDTWKEVYRYELPATGRIRCLAWQPDSRGFAVGTENLKIYEWKLREGAIPYQYLGHSATIFALAYHPTQPLLVSQSWDGTTRVWDSLSRQINAVFPWMGRRTFFTPDGMTLCMENETDSSTVLVSYNPSEACRTFTVQHRDLDEVGTAGCWSVDFNPDGTLLACGDTSGLWMFHLDKPLPPLLLMDTYCWNEIRRAHV